LRVLDGGAVEVETGDCQICGVLTDANCVREGQAVGRESVKRGSAAVIEAEEGQADHGNGLVESHDQMNRFACLQGAIVGAIDDRSHRGQIHVQGAAGGKGAVGELEVLDIGDSVRSVRSGHSIVDDGVGRVVQRDAVVGAVAGEDDRINIIAAVDAVVARAAGNAVVAGAAAERVVATLAQEDVITGETADDVVVCCGG